MLNISPQGGLIRKLCIGEAAKFCEHLLRLDPDCRRSRFAARVPDEFIRNYANTSISLDAVVHAFYVNGVMRAAAELRPLGPVHPQEAEVTFSVEKSWQGFGIGTALMRQTLLTAHSCGLELLHMACLASNGPMLRLARNFNAELRFDNGSFVGEVHPCSATTLSLVGETMAGDQGFVTAMLDLQSGSPRA